MAKQLFSPEFRDFLKLLNSHGVEYLLIGGYAVFYHGYPRHTGDMDIWIALDPTNARKAEQAIREFGFDVPSLNAKMLMTPGNVVRMGVQPIRIEVLTSISGVKFEPCYRRRIKARIDGVTVPIIGLEDLKANKKASGRHKDLADLEYLLKVGRKK